ncbi:L-sorbosone dehydrogenase [Folsomia candida]|uniref:L-sorbosone dehydrogenase n=1 Tax=Folsomia candida TaxID=158441 RepID=A0A226F5L3_FOLCA|nr:L-sorbosone dehydrogenase [Folsomia candida]OXA64718.1 L-sorbosone dehydrogenase [Folsomia candida]
MKTTVVLVTLFAAVNSQWFASPPFYASQYTGVGGARGIITDPAGDLLILGRSINGIAVVYETQNGDGTIDVVNQRIVIGNGLNLNHGVAYNDGYIYAGSASSIYRWPYTPGNRTQISVGEELVVTGLPTGGHDSHAIVFDSQGRFYCSIGSQNNVDQNSSRAKLLRFTLTGNLPKQYAEGELFAEGLRNEGGLAFDNNGVLHGVENGADNLNRADLGGDIHDLNPTEEFNRFDGPLGQHFGYPYCFSTYNLPGYAPGTQFAWPDFMNDGVHNDDWCKNVNNNRPPLIAMSAHEAPLGFDFYRGQNCGNGGGAFPCNMTGDAFVSFHGSWNRTPASGYRVARFPFNAAGNATGEELNVISELDVAGCANGPCIRPVDAAFNDNGHLFITADANGFIVRVTYGTPGPTIRRNIVRLN